MPIHGPCARASGYAVPDRTRRDLFRFLPAALAGSVCTGRVLAAPAPFSAGIQVLDELTGGLAPGSLTVLHERMKDGSAPLAMRIAGRVAVEEGRPILYI